MRFNFTVRILLSVSFLFTSALSFAADLQPENTAKIIELQSGQIILEEFQETFPLVMGTDGFLELGESHEFTRTQLAQIQSDLLQANLAYRLRHFSRTRASLENQIAQIEDHFSNRSIIKNKASLALQAAQICAVDQDFDCIQNLLAITTDSFHDSVISEQIFSLALYTSGNLPVAEARIRQTLDQFSQAKWAVRAAQDFALSVAIESLRGYYNEHHQVGILRYTGFNTLEHEHVGYTDSVRELIFNTLNYSLLTLTDWGYLLQDEWENQEDQLRKQISNFESLRKKFDHSELVLQDFLSDRGYRTVPAFITKLAENPHFSDFTPHIDGLAIPPLSELGFMPEIEFVHINWKNVIAQEINLFNILTFAEGPAAFQYLGQTRAGIWSVRTFRLQKLMTTLAKLPRPLDSFAMFLAIETADGCTIRWGYALWKAGGTLRSGE